MYLTTCGVTWDDAHLLGANFIFADGSAGGGTETTTFGDTSPATNYLGEDVTPETEGEITSVYQSSNSSP